LKNKFDSNDREMIIFLFANGKDLLIKVKLQEILDSLSDMYELLQEEDMWSGLWQKHARYRETNVAIAYEQQGFFEQAQV
jgi:phosphatidylinositol kinase/protein kinase (PI-3  family)